MKIIYMLVTMDFFSKNSAKSLALFKLLTLRVNSQSGCYQQKQPAIN